MQPMAVHFTFLYISNFTGIKIEHLKLALEFEPCTCDQITTLQKFPCAEPLNQINCSCELTLIILRSKALPWNHTSLCLYRVF